MLIAGPGSTVEELRAGKSEQSRPFFLSGKSVVVRRVGWVHPFFRRPLTVSGPGWRVRLCRVRRLNPPGSHMDDTCAATVDTATGPSVLISLCIVRERRHCASLAEAAASSSKASIEPSAAVPILKDKAE